MAKAAKPTNREVRNAGAVLGARSWRSRVKKFGLPQLRKNLSRVGKLGGRPRKQDPQDEVK